jgi:hypothetical protein
VPGDDVRIGGEGVGAKFVGRREVRAREQRGRRHMPGGEIACGRIRHGQDRVGADAIRQFVLPVPRALLPGSEQPAPVGALVRVVDGDDLRADAAPRQAAIRRRMEDVDALAAQTRRQLAFLPRRFAATERDDVRADAVHVHRRRRRHAEQDEIDIRPGRQRAQQA